MATPQNPTPPVTPVTTPASPDTEPGGDGSEDPGSEADTLVPGAPQEAPKKPV